MSKSRRAAQQVQQQLNLPEPRPSISGGGIDLTSEAMGEVAAFGNEAVAQAVGEAVAHVPIPPSGPGDPGDTHDKGESAALSIKDKAGTGAPLPGGMQEQMQDQLGHDVGGVRVHANEPAVGDMNAQAAQLGDDVFFAPGQYQPGTPGGDGLIAHELTHTIQSGAATGDSLSTSTPGDASERQADAVASSVESGGKAADITPGSSSGDTIHLASAGVHQRVEMEAVGVEEPGLLHDMDRNTEDLSADQRAALEMYSGNWMRDFSQLNAPTVVENLRNVPRNPLGGDTTPIGASGATTLIDGVIRAFGIIELGPHIANSMVRPDRVGQYEAQEHIDNPMGNTSADFTVVDNQGNYVEADNVSVSDEMIDNQLSGAAIQGRQFMNPNLYAASDQGLANHIYNSIEYSKNQLIQAATLGEGAEGRSHVGAALHLVEDYYTHTNVIEVMLNKYIADAMAERSAGRDDEHSAGKAQLLDQLDANSVSTDQGYYVDTLYDETVTGPGGATRQVVTSGTFGGTDTMMSLAHMLLPLVPKAEQALHSAIDRVFAALDSAQQPSTWDQIVAAAGNDRPMMALDAVGKAADAAGMMLPVPTGFSLDWSELQISPGWIGDPWTVDVPSGVSVDTENKSITQGIGFYAGLYQQAQEIIDTIQRYTRYIGLGWLVDRVRELLRSALAGVRQRAKQMLTQMLTQLVQAVTGVNPQEESHTTLQDAVRLAEEQLQEVEAGTSLQSRMGNEDGDLYNDTRGLDEDGNAMSDEERDRVRQRLEDQLGELTGDGTPGSPWVPANPLPPSHTEINKDHGPKDIEGGDGDTMAEQGSLFYGPAESLCVEADRHLLRQMAEVWGSDVLGRGGPQEAETHASRESVLADAAANSDTERQDAYLGMRTRAQDDGPAAIVGSPGMQELLDMVDIFMGHPESSQWWSPTMDAYVAANSGEVYDHIVARNRTRSSRT